MGLDEHPIDNKTAKEDCKIIRKFINSAIYVEKSISDQSISQNSSKDELQEIYSLKTKRCTCATDQKSCFYHWNNSQQKLTPAKETKKPVKKGSGVRAKFSSSLQDTGQDQSLKNLIAKKKPEELKKMELLKKMQEEIKLKQRNELLEKERENFKKWLENKKKLELQTKKQKEKELEKLKQEREKKQLENELKFKLWVKRKEEENLEKKIKQQMLLLQELELKENQAKENEGAYEKWLKTSKTKRKPISPNKGIQCN